MVLVTLKTGVMMLKTQLSIAGINYIFKYTTNEYSYYIYLFLQKSQFYRLTVFILMNAAWCVLIIPYFLLVVNR